MYIRLGVYVYIYIHICVYVCVRVYHMKRVYILERVCKHIDIYIYTHTDPYAHFSLVGNGVGGRRQPRAQGACQLFPRAESQEVYRA